MWLPLDSGIYSTKSDYNSKAQSSIPAGLQTVTTTPTSNLEFDWLKDVWVSKTAPKLKLFLRLIIQGDLPLGVEFQCRGMNFAALCSLPPL